MYVHVWCAPNKLPVFGQFNEGPVPFCFRSLVVRYLFMICSYSFQYLFEVCALFLSISNLLYIRDQLLHEAVYNFYSLLKNVHAGQQFVCGRKRDSDSLSACVTHFARSQTLFTCFFPPFSPTTYVVALFVRSCSALSIS